MLFLTYSTAVICAVFIIRGAVSGADVKKAVGEMVSFRPDKLESTVTSITWKHVSLATVKAIEWDVDDGVITPNQRFKDITTLDEKTGQITIIKLKVEHSGNYTIDINSKEQEQRFSLVVLERVPKPEITVEESGNPDVVYLRCEYSGTIIWRNSTGETLEGKTNHKPGEFIIVKNTKNPENYYTCTLENAVGDETSEPVYERDLFKTGSNAGLIAGIISFLFLLLLLLIIGLICVCLRKEPIYSHVNKCCPWIESVLSHVDCCAQKRKQYNLAPKGEEMKVDAASTGDETKVDAVSTGDKTKVDAVNTGEEMKVDAASTGDETKVDAVSTGDETKVDAVSTDQNNVEDNHVSDATQSQNQ